MHQTVGRRQARDRAEYRDAGAFDEDLKEDRRVRSAEGFARADLANALIDAGEHDVHDANATDQQTQAGDDSTADARVADSFIDVFHLVFLRAESEIFDSIMRHHQNISCLLKGRV